MMQGRKNGIKGQTQDSQSDPEVLKSASIAAVGILARGKRAFYVALCKIRLNNPVGRINAKKPQQRAKCDNETTHYKRKRCIRDGTRRQNASRI